MYIECTCLDNRTYFAVSLELLLLFLKILIHGHQRSKLLQNPVAKVWHVKESMAERERESTSSHFNLLSIFVSFHLIQFLHLLCYLLAVCLHLRAVSSKFIPDTLHSFNSPFLACLVLPHTAGTVRHDGLEATVETVCTHVSEDRQGTCIYMYGSK